MSEINKKNMPVINLSAKDHCFHTDLSFIVFKSEYSLRCHLMNHFLDQYEWKSFWKNYLDEESYTNIMSELENISCPYIVKNEINSLNESRRKCFSCKLFNSCSEKVMKNVHQIYVTAINQILSETLNKPRFVEYTSLYDNCKQMMAFHDEKIRIHCKQINDNNYCITTVFVYRAYLFLSLNDALKKISEKVINESNGKCFWFNKITWGIVNDKKVDNLKDSKRQRIIKPYKRSKASTDFRKHLEDLELGYNNGN